MLSLASQANKPSINETNVLFLTAQQSGLDVDGKECFHPSLINRQVSGLGRLSQACA